MNEYTKQDFVSRGNPMKPEEYRIIIINLCDKDIVSLCNELKRNVK